MMAGLAFRRTLFSRTLWPSAPNIYPQVFLAATLARDYGSVLSSGPAGLTIGGTADTAVNRARTRPADFGIAERMKHLSQAVREMSPRNQLTIMNRGVHDLMVWGWMVFDEMSVEDKKTADRYIAALMQVEYVYTSPYMINTWVRHVARAPASRRSARYVLPAALRGMFHERFWRAIRNWNNVKAGEQETP